MGYVMRFKDNDSIEYKEAGKRAKNGIAMVMDGIENNDMRMVMEGAEKAWDGVRTMCSISDEMEDRYSERRYDNMDMRGGYSNRGSYGNRGGYNYRQENDWNQRDDEMMTRRMRDARGRYM